MVNKKHKDSTDQADDSLTYTPAESTETDLVEEEASYEQKLKVLRTKLQTEIDQNRNLQEEIQRTKADFLNARKRLEGEVQLSKDREVIRHIEKLLPLADSFFLAMLDKTAWEKGDEKWRKGVEGINQQLQSILSGYQVTAFDPSGETFDPTKEEAMMTVPVTDPDLHDKVLTVMQLGYEKRNTDGSQIIIRPARVTVGEYTKAG